MAVDYSTLKKGGYMRQKQKNNFSLRLRVVGGNLTSKQLANIAEAAEKFGDGYVHLTSRQSVEIPFVKLESVEEIEKQKAVIAKFLPKMMSEDEIRNEIAKLEDKKIPSVMKHFKTNFNGLCDMAVVSKIAKEFQ